MNGPHDDNKEKGYNDVPIDALPIEELSKMSKGKVLGIVNQMGKIQNKSDIRIMFAYGYGFSWSELLDEVEEKSREEAGCKNFNEMVERVKKIEECRKLTDEIAKLKGELKNAETHFKFVDEDYNKAVDEYREITKEFERRKAAWESAKKVKEQYAKKFEELDNRRAELDAEIKAESCDVSAFWDVFLRQYFGK